jgi:hypothetical protein
MLRIVALIALVCVRTASTVRSRAAVAVADEDALEWKLECSGKSRSTGTNHRR